MLNELLAKIKQDSRNKLAGSQFERTLTYIEKSSIAKTESFTVVYLRL